MKKLIRDLGVLTTLFFFAFIGRSVTADQSQTTSTDYRAVAAAIEAKMQAYHYDPAELETDAYQLVKNAVASLAESVDSDQAFIDGFREIWKSGPFSHVELNRAEQTADELAAYLDTLRVGNAGAVLTWNNKIAVLTVNTMMGLDTIEQIDAAYVEIVNKRASALIIDLRENGGGAFAIRPLVGHLLRKNYNAGGFVSQPWHAKHRRAPTAEELAQSPPWEGWSIRAFWKDAQEALVVKLSFGPIESIFDGPVYVLTSKRTASAAELATDALKNSGRAKIIGENTAGQMLSQKIYDIQGGFHLSLPIADYYSVTGGRIEGNGINPDIEVEASEAMDFAIELESTNKKHDVQND